MSADGSEWAREAVARSEEIAAELYRSGDGEFSRYFSDFGAVWVETYRHGISLHRVTGPAWRSFSTDGHLLEEEWFVGGKLHRVDGPAVVRRDRDGTVDTTKWFLLGEQLPDALVLSLALSSWSAESIDFELGRSSYAPLLAAGVPREEILGLIRDEIFEPEILAEIVAGAPVEWVRSYRAGAST